MRAANWALEHDVSTVIANGFAENTIINIVNGKRIGTFFNSSESDSMPIEVQAAKGNAATSAFFG